MVDLSIKQVDPASGWIAVQYGTLGIAEQWVRGIGDDALEVVCSRYASGWRVDVGVMEFLRMDPLGEQLEADIDTAITAGLEQVPGVREASRDPMPGSYSDDWRVEGIPSGRDLVRAAADVLDRFAAKARVALNARDAWSLAAPNFQGQDECLMPDIYLEDLLPSEVPAIYAFLRDRSQKDPEVQFYDNELEVEGSLISVPDPASMLASGRVSTVNQSGLEVLVAGTVLPPFSIIYYRDLINIWYDMGEQWQKPEVFGLFTLLQEIIALTQSAKLVVHDDRPPYPRMFMAAWRRFNA